MTSICDTIKLMDASVDRCSAKLIELRSVPAYKLQLTAWHESVTYLSGNPVTFNPPFGEYPKLDLEIAIGLEQDDFLEGLHALKQTQKHFHHLSLNHGEAVHYYCCADKGIPAAGSVAAAAVETVVEDEVPSFLPPRETEQDEVPSYLPPRTSCTVVSPVVVVPKQTGKRKFLPEDE